MKLQFREAELGDDEAMCIFYNQTGMGPKVTTRLIRNQFLRSENFLAEASKTLVLVDDGGVVYGTGSCTIRDASLHPNGKSVGYMSSLRLDPAVRGGRYLFDGYRHMKALVDEMGCDAVVTSVFADNEPFMKLFSKPRRNMPVYMPLTEYSTFTIPARRRKGCSYEVDVEIDQESGVSIHKISVHSMDGSVIGTTELLDVSCLKYASLIRLPKHLQLSKYLVNFTLACRGCKSLPVPGEPIRVLYVNRPKLQKEGCANQQLFFKTLQHYCFELESFQFLTMGCSVHDAVHDVVSRFSIHKIVSRLYQVRWPSQTLDLSPESVHLDIAFL